MLVVALSHVVLFLSITFFLLSSLTVSFPSFVAINSGGATDGCGDKEGKALLLRGVLLSVEAIRCSGSGGGDDESPMCCMVEDSSVVLVVVVVVVVLLVLESDVNNCLCWKVEGRLMPGFVGSGCSRKIPAARAGHMRRYTRASLLYTYTYNICM